MEIDCCSVGVTMVEQSLLTCAGFEAALATLIVSTLVRTHYLFLTQEYMKLLMEPKMRGDHHTCFPCKAIDAEDDDGNEDEDEDEEGKEDISYEDGNPGGNKNGPDGEENVNKEDDQDDNDDEANKDDEEDDEEDEEGGDDEEDGKEDEAGGDDEEDEEEVVEEEEEEEEETLQPPKKRKK